jgi:hypothetical protein
VPAVTRPAPLMAPSALMVTRSPAAVVVPVRVMLPPLPAPVRRPMLLPVPPASMGPVTVSAPAVLASVMAPSLVVTVPRPRLPPPAWSKVMLPVPVVRLDTVTALPRVLSRSMLPLAVSALMLPAASCSGVVAPMPVLASRSTVPAVTRPAPLMAPSALMVTLVTRGGGGAGEGDVAAAGAGARSMFRPAPPAVMGPVTVSAPAVLASVMAPSVVVTVPRPRLPPPLWLKPMAPAALSRLTVTGWRGHWRHRCCRR